MATIPFSIRNRWSGEVQFTAQIECAEDALPGVKLGLAVKWARDSGADLSGAHLSDAHLRGADLSGADLRGADLSGADLSDADLRGAHLSGAHLSDAHLRGADLSDADLRDAHLRGADLSGAHLRGAHLSGAHLSDAHLSGAHLSDADLRGAHLSGAHLSDAHLRGADLSDANLRGADLSGADLSDANLRGAHLSDADLRGANLRGAVLRSFRSDLWLTLASAQAEIPGLIAAIREGRIDGSVYGGSCACLVGTIANVRGVPVSTLDRGSQRPAEQWFAMIRPGDKPGDPTGGGFAAQWALTECLEFCRTFGIDPDGASQDHGGEAA